MRTATVRIMAVDKEPLTVYRAQTEQSERAGTKNVYIVHSIIEAQLTPVRDVVSLEIYGDRIQRMYTINAEKGVDLQLNDKIQRGNDFFKVIAVQAYTNHVSATIEQTGVL